jgi:hypothetical protein
VTIVAACILSALSGSAVADAAALTALLLPMMVKAGHDKARSGGLIAACGVIGPIIPPSIGFVIFGVAANVSVRKLFLAGIFPGIWLAIGLWFTWWWLTRREELEMPERRSAAEIWQALREAGATISVDNFGSAPIDLRRLRLLPVDRVKIDRTMIADITHCNESRAILQSSVTVLNSLGKETVAEGVESQDQFDMLRVMGCKAAQGYAIARPGSEAALRNFMVPSDAAPKRRKA